MPNSNSAPIAAPSAPSTVLQEALAQARKGRGGASAVTRLRAGYTPSEDDMQREAETLTSYSIYRGRYGDTLVRPEDRDIPADKRTASTDGVMPINHLPRWLDLWSALYCEEPSRTFFHKGERVKEDSPLFATVEAVQENYRAASVDSVLRKVDALLRLVGNVVLIPHWDALNSEMVIHQYLSYRLRVVRNAANPARPLATIISGRTIGEMDQKPVDIAQVWLAEGRYLSMVDGVVKVDESPVSVPLVHCFDTLPDNESGYFVDCPGPALADLAVRIINDGYSDLNFTSLMQGFGVAQIFGQNAGEDLKIGPARVVKFSGDTDRRQGIEFASPNAPLLDRVEVVKALVESIRQAYGIPASMLDVSTDASGAAIVQANGPLAEIRRDRAKVFRRIETDLLRATLMVLSGNGITGDTKPADWDVSVSYGKPQASASVQDRIAQEKHDLEIGLITPAELLMQRKPDSFDTVEEADEYLRARMVAGGVDPKIFADNKPPIDNTGEKSIP